MAVIQLNEENQLFAQDVMDLVHAVLCRHEEIDFEDQLAIVGVAIGSILHQFRESERKYLMRVLMKNVEFAPQFTQTMMQ